MNYVFQLTETHLIIQWEELYFDKFINSDSKRIKSHHIPLYEVSKFLLFLKDHKDEIERLLRHQKEAERQRLETELSNIASQLDRLS